MADPIQTILTELLELINAPTAGAPSVVWRAKGLKVLNKSERRIAQRGSMTYLNHRNAAFSLGNGAETLAVPTSPAMDYGKAATITGPNGPLEFVPIDQFYSVNRFTYNAVDVTKPSRWTLVDSATILFDRPNTSGVAYVMTLLYQKAIAALVDTGASFSLLPDGYEWTLLLIDAEIQWKRELERPLDQWVIEDHAAALESFYDAQWARKPESQKGEESAKKQIHRTKIAPGT